MFSVFRVAQLSSLLHCSDCQHGGGFSGSSSTAEYSGGRSYGRCVRYIGTPFERALTQARRNCRSGGACPEGAGSAFRRRRPRGFSSVGTRSPPSLRLLCAVRPRPASSRHRLLWLLPSRGRSNAADGHPLRTLNSSRERGASCSIFVVALKKKKGRKMYFG